MILLKNNASITRPSSGRAPLTPLQRNARDFRPVFCPYFCYWPAAGRHPGSQPLSPSSNLHSPPVRFVPRTTLRGGSAGGSLVRLFRFPPLIGLPFLRFKAVVSSLFLLFVFSIFCVYRDDVLCWLRSCPFSSVCFLCLSPNVFPVRFRLVPSILWPRLDS